MDKFVASVSSSSGKQTEWLDRQNHLHVVDIQNQYPMSLTRLLLQYKIGQRILMYYEKENELTENLRNKLCDAIITDIDDRDINV